MIKKLSLFACLAFFALSCEEIPPRLNPGGGINPNPTDQQRHVLIEEFTGVRCVNCPAGSAAIETLRSIYGDQLIAVSIHAGFFAPPYPESTQDFRTTEGTNILSYLGEPLGYPTAVVNRKLFSGEPDLQTGQGQWPGFVAEEAALPPQVSIEIEKNYIPATRGLQVNIKLDALETIAENDLRLSVMITEDEVTDTQLTPAGKTNNYAHRHVLRAMMSAYDGLPLGESLELGDELSRSFNYALPLAWNAEKCHIIAFLHHSSADKSVIQAQELKVTD